MIFKTGKGIIQAGNGIISPTSRPLIQKLLLQHLFHINQGVQNWLSKQEMELFKLEMELFFLLPDLQSKNFFYKMFLIYTKEFKIGFQNRKWNYLSDFQASNQKNSFTK